MSVWNKSKPYERVLQTHRLGTVMLNILVKESKKLYWYGYR